MFQQAGGLKHVIANKYTNATFESVSKRDSLLINPCSCQCDFLPANAVVKMSSLTGLCTAITPNSDTQGKNNTDKTTSQDRHQVGAEGICVKIKKRESFSPSPPTSLPGRAGVIEPVNEPWQLGLPRRLSLARSLVHYHYRRRHRDHCPTMLLSMSSNHSQLVLDLGNRILDGLRRLAGDAASLGPHALRRLARLRRDRRHRGTRRPTEARR